MERTVISSNGKIRTLRPRIKKYSLNPNGYPVVSLCKNSITRTKFVHRVIAIAFIPNPDNKPYIDHINRNLLDFRLDNLHWVTQKENINNPNSIEYCKQFVDKRKSAILANETKRNKATQTAPKRVYKFSLDGIFIEEYESLKDAERKTGYNSCGIGSVLDKSAYMIGGYLWSTTRHINYKYTPNIQPFFKPVVQLNDEGKIIGQWQSMTKAAKALGISRKVIERGLRTGTFALAQYPSNNHL